MLMFRSDKLLSCLLCFLPLTVVSQTDTEFWFAAPEVGVENLDFDKPIYLRISAFSQSAVVTISQPANASFITQTAAVPANSSVTVDLTSQITIIENQPPNTILNYGLLIQSTNPVTAYYEVFSSTCLCNPEIFSLKGQNALGTEFYIPTQNFWRNTNTYSSPTPYSSFDIVATEDNTTVTITPKKDIIGHAAGSTFSITLNKGQTYSATAVSQLASDHLGGSKVISDKPIAITEKDDLLEHLSYGTCRDLAGDQIVPTNVIGKKYVVVKGFLNGADKAFIIATKNNTDIFINGNTTPVATINETETFSYDILSGSIYIETSEPVYVLHVSGATCEVGSSLLPTIECTGSAQVSFTRSTDQNFGLIIIVRNGGQNSFLLNGSSSLIPGSAFTAVPGTGGQWFSAKITFSTTDVPVNTASLVTNSSELFHLGFINGDVHGCRYGYFANYNTLDASVTPDVSLCKGDSTVLIASGGINYLWSPGIYLSDSTIASPIAKPDSTTNYTVIVSAGGCIDTADVTVDVKTPPQAIISPDTFICPGQFVTLSASGGVSYAWSPDYNLSNPSIPNPVASPDTTTTYYATITAANGCEVTAPVTIFVLQSIPTTANANICSSDSFFAAGIWQHSNGIYYDTIKTTAGCDTIKETHLSVSDTIRISSNSTICQGDSLFAGGAWQKTSGTYLDSFKGSGGCDSIMVTNLLVSSLPALSAMADTSLLPGFPVTLSAASSATALVWSPPTWLSCTQCPAPVATPQQSITYYVEATDQFGCKASDSVLITLLKDECIRVVVPSAFSPNADGVNDKIGPIVSGDLHVDVFRIFNRWGELVYETYDYTRWWDGAYKGELQQIAVFTWYLSYTCENKTFLITGNITLIQ